MTIALTGLEYAADHDLAELERRDGVGADAILARLQIGPFDPDHRLGKLGMAVFIKHCSGQAAGLKPIDVYTFCAKVLACMLLSIGNEVLESDQVGMAVAVTPATGQEQYAQQKHRGCGIRLGKAVSHRLSVSCLLTTYHRARRLIHHFSIKDVIRGHLFPNHSHHRDTL
jgi:hypothetical protein